MVSASSIVFSRSIRATSIRSRSGHLGRQVDPPGGRARPGDQRRDQRGRQAVGGDVLRHVAGFQAGADHLGPAGRAQRLDRRVIQQRSLADHPLADLLAVRHDGAACLVQRDRAELHGVGFGGSGALRRTATISAMIDKAISGAVTASIFRPTGPRMRDKALS